MFFILSPKGSIIFISISRTGETEALKVKSLIMVSQPGCDADSPASGNQGVRLCAIHLLRAHKERAQVLDRGMINVQQGGLEQDS